VGMAWALFGYSVAFGRASTWCGGSAYFLLRGVGLQAQGSIPHVLFFAYQGTFAIITAALISGAVVARMRFGPYVVFIALWTLVVWTMLDLVRTRKVTAIGAATAIVVGLVAITPAAGFIGPQLAIALGAIAAVPSYFALLYRARTRLDDSLDVVAAHGVGGIVGALLTGVLADRTWNGDTGSGSLHQLGVQAIAVIATILYSGVGTLELVKLLAMITSLRAEARDEGLGLDFTQHGEEAYSRGEGA